MPLCGVLRLCLLQYPLATITKTHYYRYHYNKYLLFSLHAAFLPVQQMKVAPDSVRCDSSSRYQLLMCIRGGNAAVSKQQKLQLEVVTIVTQTLVMF